MALEPCNVCGALNSSDAEICLSCGYSTKGRKRSVLYQWVAIALFAGMVSLMIAGIVDAINAPPKLPNPQNTPPTLEA
ncbi:MAG: hypothetical protein AAGD25_30175 [Cyanobacteria bacterium P01_F01_bin.150]